jgi:molybdopterin synthase catalytic subunit
VVILTRGTIDAQALRRAVLHPACGAVVVFHGAVREENEGRRVTHLEYEAYESMAQEALERLAREVAADHGLGGIACAHRLGRLEIGEDALVVAVAAPHRGPALDAVATFVSRLKREVPIWKKEHFEGGAVWVGSPEDPQGEGLAGGAPAQGGDA